MLYIGEEGTEGAMAGKALTIADIARLANTSTATVSNYLNGRLSKMSAETRKRIERIIGETGYAPNGAAQALASKNSQVIAVLIKDNTNIWAGQLVGSIEVVAHQSGYQTFVCDTHFDPQVERSYVEKMLSLGVDGFIIQPTKHYRSVNDRLRRAGKPVVFYDFSLMDLTSTWVKTDLYGGVYDAISACVNKGYQDFLILSAEVESSMRTRAERFQGFSDALDEHGIEFRTISVSNESPGADELRRIFERSVNPARRTLIFCPHQWCLTRIYKAISPMRHLIPERIGLLGLNNADWTDLVDPGISTIVEPVAEEGRLACSMLINLIQNPDASPRQQMLSCETRWLSSTL